MTDPYSPWMLLAGNALGHATARRYVEAGETVKLLVEKCPGCVMSMMLAWLDTTILHCGLADEFAAARQAGQEILFLWQEDRPGAEITDADHTLPGVVWAGRLLAARLDMDADQWNALINSIGADDFSDGVSHLLGMCGAMLRRQFAQTGVPPEAR